MLHHDARRLELALARLLHPFHDALQQIVDRMAPALPVAQDLRDVSPETLPARHLGLEHLGRWIYLPGRPALGGPKAAAEPSVAAAAGRLVGIRPGKLGAADQPGTRVLVLAQGSALAELSVSVADRVDVAPRDWN